jgi:plasmid maintenance system antidote protein VapI
LAARLRTRGSEIEAAVLTRVIAIHDPAEVADPTYMEGLRAALQAALGYGLVGVERGEERTSPVPVAALAQARLAARNDIGLDTVLRRYFAGYTVFGGFLIEEAEGEEVDQETLMRLLGVQAETFERLITAIAREYERARREDRYENTGRRRRRLVEELLAGQRTEAAELRYGFDVWHLGLITVGPAGADAVAELARSLEASHLLVPQEEEEVVWAWLAGGRVLERDHFELRQHLRPRPGIVIAAGEPGRGLSGWRLTHRQAAAALAVSRRDQAPLVRYRDVALLAAAARDELLRSSLEQVFLAPLSAGRDGGAALRLTLNAWFAADHNAASAAAALGVSRQTVNSRLRNAEELLGCSLESCAAELHTALRLGALSKRQAG